MQDPKADFPPLPARQAAFLRQRREVVVPLLPRYSNLIERLLELGGMDVVLRPIDQYSDVARRRHEHEVAELLERGRTWRGPAYALEIMEASNCHQNVARLHAAGRGEIVTGWALAPDGLWREHSWVLSAGRADRILETTSNWVLYHGFVLTPEEAAGFVASELGAQAP